MDPTSIILIVTTSMNLLLQLVSHIKSSSCYGVKFDMYGPDPLVKK